MDPVLLFDILIVVYLGMLPAMHFRGRRVRAEVAASRSWAAAASTVVEATLRESYFSKGGTTYWPAVVYEFEANGVRYRGERLYFGDPVSYSWKRNADRELASLADGARVQVFYDPTDPTRSVIQRRAPILRRYTFLFLVMVAFLVVMVGFRMYIAGLLEPQPPG